MQKLLAAAAAAALFAACDKQSEPVASPPPTTARDVEARKPQPKPHPAKPPEPPRPAVGSGGGSMTDFKPRTAFHAHAAQILKVPPGELDGGAIDEATAKAQPNGVGGAWAYVVWLKSDRNSDVRGWVTADGTVISPEQNLGRLLAEAGLWTKPMPRTADEMGDLIAERLVWAYGMDKGHGLVTQRINKMAPPELKLAPNGTGTLVFFTSWRRSGPGGAGGGPVTYTQNVVTFGADHKATLAKTPHST